MLASTHEPYPPVAALCTVAKALLATTLPTADWAPDANDSVAIRSLSVYAKWDGNTSWAKL
jgi:hypothetical protein